MEVINVPQIIFPAEFLFGLPKETGYDIVPTLL